MCADSFDYKTAAGLHRDRLAEAESIRRVRAAKRSPAGTDYIPRNRIGRQLIALGERISVA